jgi:hypothetical protein
VIKGVKMETAYLIERIKELPPEKITEVEDFVEFLHQRSAQQGKMNGESARATELAAIAASMQANTFTGDPPRFSREELHERH